MPVASAPAAVQQLHQTDDAVLECAGRRVPELVQPGDRIPVRRLRGMKVAKNVARILDAFEEEGWPDRIDDPLPGGRKPPRLRGAVATLNRGLSAIKFRADGTGEGILWEAR